MSTTIDPTPAPIQAHKQSPYVVKIVIWAGMVSFLFVYLLMGYVAAVAPDVGPKIISGPLLVIRDILVAAAIMAFALAAILPRFLKRSPQKDPDGFVLYVSQLVLLEAGGLFGFLYTMLSQHLEYTTWSGAISFLGMCLIYPRKKS